MIFETIIVTFGPYPCLKNHYLPLQTENFQKIFFEKIRKKKIFFWKKQICEKVPSLSQKTMINHKMSKCWVYENVF